MVHVEQLQAGDHQVVEHLDDVVVVDEGVGQAHEALRQLRPPLQAPLGRHGSSSGPR